MKVEINFKFNEKVYLVNDPEQQEYRINRIILEEGRKIVLELFGPSGDIVEAKEVYVSKEINILAGQGTKEGLDES